MSDRRPLSSYAQLGNYDLPAATQSLSESVSTRLDRLRRTLEIHRVESRRRESEVARNSRWGAPPSLRRRRLRPAGHQLATFEENDRFYSCSSGSSDAEDDLQPRHAKRRKLNTDDAFTGARSFRYGHYGQVESGRLKLELHSYSGGVHNERGPVYYGVENILKHDQSVYCSKSPKSVIVLQHHDMTDFCLEKLYIIAPNNGFTAPVKEGTITVGMSVQDCLTARNEGTLADTIRAALPGGINRYLQSERPRLPNTQNERRVRDFMREREPSVQELDALTRGDVDGYWALQEERLWDRGPMEGGETDWPPLQPTFRPPREITLEGEEVPEPATVLASGMMVTMLNAEDISWPEEPSTAAVLRDRQHRMESMRLEDDDYEDDLATELRNAGAYARARRANRTNTQISREESPLREVKPRSEVNVTMVKFRIKSGRHKVAIKFDPPVSGNCIMLQLEAPPGGPNIDIQSVLACGYAGPRFFPALQYA